MNWLHEALESGTILCDGAMGTMLLRVGLRLGESADLWNLDRAESVEEILSDYVEAGAQVLTSNSFGGNPLSLARHGLEHRARELNFEAIQLAKRASGGRARVVGDVGPFGGFLEPYGDTSHDDLREALAVQLETFREAGADGVLIETMADPAEVKIAIEVAKDVSDWPVLASYAFTDGHGEFRTIMGASVADALNAAYDAGADVSGANCGTIMDLPDYTRLAIQMVAAAGDRPVILQPNAGPPRVAGSDVDYDLSAQEMGVWTRQVVDAGIQIVGGCCGTTSAHIRAMAAVLGSRG